MIASVRFQPRGRAYHFDASDHQGLRPGDFVLVETARGQQLGEVVSVRPLHEGEGDEGLKPVRRRATGRDATQLGLPVKIVTAEYTFDGQRLTLLYASEEKKVNLDKLRQRLQHTLSVRVDLRRIGPRDQAKLMGGYGACGEPRCCSRFLAEFSPVSIKMAKMQGVVLSPSKWPRCRGYRSIPRRSRECVGGCVAAWSTSMNSTRKRVR
jgi:cell fate regulator YaaT (PSP1 superfamily)